MVAKIRGYFDPINDNLWKCCACSKQLNGKNSSNLKQHLKVRHPDIYTEFCGDNGKPSEVSLNGNNAGRGKNLFT